MVINLRDRREGSCSLIRYISAPVQYSSKQRVVGGCFESLCVCAPALPTVSISPPRCRPQGTFDTAASLSPPSRSGLMMPRGNMIVRTLPSGGVSSCSLTWVWHRFPLVYIVSHRDRREGLGSLIHQRARNPFSCNEKNRA